MSKPLFTFGVMTFNRREMLKDCLTSILNQTNQDFEVIVGNDFTDDVITSESLGISDSRIRIINHPKNLGEVNNMNYLLSQAKGRYFSWIGDDDLVMPQFLEMIHSAIEKFSNPECVFCLYDEGDIHDFNPRLVDDSSLQLITGGVFLRRYLSQKLKLIGCYGGFKTEYLKEIGGIKALGNGFSPYADNLLAIRGGLFSKVVYVDSPLFFFRTHNQSISYTCNDLMAYTSAQQDLLPKCEAIFKHDSLTKNRKVNMFHLLMWCSGDIYGVLLRGSLLFPRSFIIHMRLLEKYARGMTGWFYFKFLSLNIWLVFKYLARRIRKKVWLV